MAVDLQRLRHMMLTTGAGGGGHHQLANRAGASAAVMPTSGPCYYGAAVPSQQSYMDLFTPPPTTLAGQDQYSEFLAMAAVNLAKKGVRLDGAQEMIANKRKREEQSSVLGAADVLAAHAQQQTIAVDRILLKHAKKMWTTLAEQRRSHMRMIVSTVEARAAKRLKAKDEEIERVWSMNWALEDRLRNLYMEAQLWRDAAQSSEVTANVLRGDLQRALDAQAVCGGGGCGGDGDGEDDAESCCWGENQAPFCGEEEVGTPPVAERPTTGAGRCKWCGEGAAVVLLMPCRHLCVCAPCAAGAHACPSCGCAKNGSVCVNFS